MVPGVPIRASLLLVVLAVVSVSRFPAATTTNALIPNPLSSKRATNAATSGIKIVFCGFGRHGTHSLHAALERLGYTPLHGEDLLENIPSHAAIVDAMMDKDVPRMMEATEAMGYDATLELHGFFWRDIMEYYETTTKKDHNNNNNNTIKYIFTLRDFDRWFESSMQLVMIVRLLTSFPLNTIPSLQKQLAVTTSCLAHQTGKTDAAVLELLRNPDKTSFRKERKKLYDFYTKDALEITSRNPNNALLLRLGTTTYQDLCDFLEISHDDCPIGEAYPHLSNTKDIKKTKFLLRLVAAAVIIVPVWMVAVVVWILIKAIQWMIPSQMAKEATAKQGKVKTT